MEFIDACKELINIDSSPSNGTGQICRFIEKLCQEKNIHVQREEEVHRGIEQANIICSPQPIEVDNFLMLQTHLDTVDPGSFVLWEKTGRNPFQASIHKDHIYGLGAADTKLDFLCKLYAAIELKEQNFKKNFVVVGTYGEEYNMQGAIHLIRHKKVRPQLALVGEPTQFDLVHIGKGLANVEITLPFSKEEIECRVHHDTGESQTTQSKIFRGLAAHSSRPDKGENAIVKLLKYLKQLPDQILILDMDGGTNHNTIPTQAVLEFDIYPLQEQTVNQKLIKVYETIEGLQKKFDECPDERFEPSTTTFNIGMIRSFSDHLKLMGCVRWPPKVNEETYMSWMETLRTECSQWGGVFRVRDFKRPFSTDKESLFAQTCLESIQSHSPEAQLTTQPVTNEANVFSKFSIETLVFGPGIREGNAHTPQESISIDSLNRAKEIYKDIIKKLCC